MTMTKQDKHKMSEIDDAISKMFDIKKRLGKGAYGIVWKAVDKRTNQTIAVKKIFDAFRDETDAQRTFREISFLSAFHDHDNIIKLVNIHKAENNLDIYLIFEFMESDLHNVIKKGTVLKDIHKRFIMYQLINALRYIHSGNVIHRDLKPSNVLLDSKCRCKLADFGLARSVSNQQAIEAKPDVIQPMLTDYVATRWYRAPEILVASKRYTKGIDMWSLGCILGEMILGKPLFPGSSTVNQIEKIVCALPDVKPEDVNAIGTSFGSALLNKQISKEKFVTLPQLLHGAPRQAIDLVQSLLVLDPLRRLTAAEAFRHPYLEKFQNYGPEIELNADVLPSFRDDVRLTVADYRSRLYEMARIVDKPKPTSRTHGLTNKKSVWDKKTICCDHVEVTRKQSKQKNHVEETSVLRQTYKYLARTEAETHPPLLKPSKKIITSPVGKYKVNRVTKANFREQKSLPKLDEKPKSQIARQSKLKAEPEMLRKEPERLQSGTEGLQTMPERIQREPEKIQNEPERFQKESGRFRKDHEMVPKVPERIQNQPTKTENLMQPKNRLSLDSSLTVQSIDVQNNRSANDVPKKVTAPDNSSLNKPEIATRAQQEEVVYRGRPAGEEVVYRGRPAVDAPRIQVFERCHRTTPMLARKSNTPQPSNARSELSNVADLRTPLRMGHVCYEQRLKELEAEIDKYKDEVKTFCKSSGNYIGGRESASLSSGGHQHSRGHVHQVRSRFHEQLSHKPIETSGRSGTAYNHEPAKAALNRGSGDHIRYEQKSWSKHHPQQHEHKTKPKNEYF